MAYALNIFIRYVTHNLTPYSASDKAALAHTHQFVTKGRGYSIIQRTSPQTLGYALADSPVGLLAWVYEKLEAWSDAYPWGDDEGVLCFLFLLCFAASIFSSPFVVHVLTDYFITVLTWVSIYWFSASGPAASLRIYYERQHSADNEDTSPAPNIPMGFSYFPKEIHVYPRL